MKLPRQNHLSDKLRKEFSSVAELRKKEYPQRGCEKNSVQSPNFAKKYTFQIFAEFAKISSHKALRPCRHYLRHRRHRHRQRRHHQRRRHQRRRHQRRRQRLRRRHQRRHHHPQRHDLPRFQGERRQAPPYLHFFFSTELEDRRSALFQHRLTSPSLQVCHSALCSRMHVALVAS